MCQMKEKQKYNKKKRTKWNGGKQFTRYRVQNNGYKDAQET